MQKTRARTALADIAAALGLLTRLPVKVDMTFALRRGASSAWAWPVAGVVVALLAALPATLALSLGLPNGVAALVLISVQVVVTGAMHEDGLADSLDGLWGGWDQARRLAIMKDSHIGTYGVLGLMIALLLRWQAWTLLMSVNIYAVAIAVAVISRWPMVLLANRLAPARTQGLGQSAGRATAPALILATLLSLSAVIAIFRDDGLVLVLAVLTVAVIWAMIAKRKIGGQTGDVLGAVQILAEVTALLALVVLLDWPR